MQGRGGRVEHALSPSLPPAKVYGTLFRAFKGKRSPRFRGEKQRPDDRPLKFISMCLEERNNTLRTRP